MFDEGISVSGDLLDMAVADDVILKSGSWFSYGEVRLGQGRENAKAFLRENSDLFDEIRQAVLIERGLVVTPKAEKSASAVEAEAEVEAKAQEA